ncbi:MAG: DUF4037 domain-containing protein [Patescibacteria group bacterium]|nr:DUF4037 domain-containing protein [Patescibacteria group bacterium]
MPINQWLDSYCQRKLLTDPLVGRYAEQSSIVTVELDHEIVYDLMVLLPDILFEREFSKRHGECFVLNDQKSVPPVFTRFKSYAWLKRDFGRRLPIALWIFGRSVIVRDPNGAFSSIVGEYSDLFKRSLRGIIERKYVEFRSDRHNLRQTVHHGDDLACSILKANIVKLAAELKLLSQGKPYPYKKWLVSEVDESNGGKTLLEISHRFIEARRPEDTIATSDELVNAVVTFLDKEGILSGDILTEWWLHLC